MTGAATESFRAGITPITSIQTNYTVNPPFHAAPSDSSQYTFEQVTTRGVIVAIDNQTYYIQNGNTTNPSSGMIIFAPINGMSRGDDVTVSGVITEFGSASQATEYSGLDYQFENATSVAEPAPVTVSPGAVGALTGSEPFPGERYEGMLVHFDHVWVADDSLPNGQYLVQFSNNTADTCRVDDNIYHHLFVDGTGLNITGVVNDAFGQYVVLPRSAADIDSFTTVGVNPGGQALAVRAALDLAEPGRVLARWPCTRELQPADGGQGERARVRPRRPHGFRAGRERRHGRRTAEHFTLTGGASRADSSEAVSSLFSCTSRIKLRPASWW